MFGTSLRNSLRRSHGHSCKNLSETYKLQVRLNKNIEFCVDYLKKNLHQKWLRPTFPSCKIQEIDEPQTVISFLDRVCELEWPRVTDEHL